MNASPVVSQLPRAASSKAAAGSAPQPARLRRRSRHSLRSHIPPTPPRAMSAGRHHLRHDLLPSPLLAVPSSARSFSYSLGAASRLHASRPSQHACQRDPRCHRLRRTPRRMALVMSAAALVREQVTERAMGTRQPAAGAAIALQPAEADLDSVVEAHRLVSEAVENLEAVHALLTQPSGLGGAARQAAGAAIGREDATMRGAGKALMMDGRLEGKRRVHTAFEKYEAAAVLVDGLPVLVPAHVQPGLMLEGAELVAGKAGIAASDVALTGGLLALTATSIHTPFGVIRLTVKRVRTRKAVRGVGAMLHEMRRVRDVLAEAAAPGGGGLVSDGCDVLTPQSS